MTRLVNLVLAISAFSLAACASPDSPCEDNPDGCGSTSPDAAGPHCGNGVCETGESSTSCAADCKPGPTCGDGTCDSTETASSCPSDCQTTIDVVNSSGVTVYYLYAWSCSVTSMGNSVLTSALYTGYNTTLTGPPGCWNFEAEGSGGTYISASYNNNLAGGQAYTWTIN